MNHTYNTNVFTLPQPGTLPNNTVITATHQQNEKLVEVPRPLPNNPPPLAPLSSSIIKSTLVSTKIEEIDSGIIPPHIIKKGDKLIKIDATDINSNNGSQKVNANKMLADLLEKKSDPPIFETPTGKRKIDNVIDAHESQPPLKRQENGELSPPDLKTNGEEKTKKAADLYAELAGSILEDEDLEEIAMTPTPQKQAVIEQKLLVAMPKPPQQAPHKQVITVPIPVQRQLIMSPNNPGQVILQSTPTQGQNQQQQVATIKTESGMQSVPIILQKQVNSSGQIMQPTLISTPPNQHGQTQYILATNPQGQQFLVAQPQSHSQPQQQTVLLAQSPQQHGKTIIILQQPGNQVVGNQGTHQKMIMTTPQGQQLLVTQSPRQQILMNNTSPHPNATGNVICAQTQSGQKIYITRQDDKHPQQQLIIQKDPGGGTGQIMIQQTPGGGQQSLINIVQPGGGQQNQLQITPQQLQSGQIVLHGSQQQLQIQQQHGQNQVHHQIVIQKQSPPTQQGQVIIQKTPSNVQLTPTNMQPSQPQVTVTQTTVAAHQQPAPPPTPPSQIQVQIKTVPQQPQTQTQQPPHLVNSNNPHHNQNPTLTIKDNTNNKVSKDTENQVTTSCTTNDTKANQPPVTTQSSNPSTTTSTSTASQNVVTSNTTSSSVTSTVAGTGSSAPTTTTVPSIPGQNQGSHIIQMIPAMDPTRIVEEDVESSWLWICDWRGCPK